MCGKIMENQNFKAVKRTADADFFKKYLAIINGDEVPLLIRRFFVLLFLKKYF